jgi:hypothetical protein
MMHTTPPVDSNACSGASKDSPAIGSARWAAGRAAVAAWIAAASSGVTVDVAEVSPSIANKNILTILQNQFVFPAAFAKFFKIKAVSENAHRYIDNTGQ